MRVSETAKDWMGAAVLGLLVVLMYGALFLLEP